jgi:8-oxo-dGTP diphosphatase
MPKSDQGATSERYRVIPRTLIFVTDGNKVLMIKGAPTKRLWANKYNGLGGHIERGEDVLSAGYRELREEAGIAVKRLQLVGSLIVDASEGVGICLFILRGEYSGGDLAASTEGTPEWVRMDRLDDYPLVEDLKQILPRALSVSPGENPFSARSFYDEQETLKVIFVD